MRLIIINDNTKNQINGVVTTYKNIIRQIEVADIHIRVIDPEDFYNVSGRILYPDLSIPLNLWKISSLVDEFSPTHVHIATEGPLGISAKLLLDSRNWNYTTSYHTRWDMFAEKAFGFKPPGINQTISWFHGKSKSVLVTTDGMSKELESIGIDNSVVWSRGVDSELFSLGYGSNSEKPTILSVGRVSIEKNLKDFCNLDSNKFNLRMVGDGPILEELKYEYPHIIFDGSLRGKDLSRAYGESDVLAFTSKTDTFGLVMIESMATGTPVAAYPVRGPIDVIDVGKTGFMEDNLEDAINKCLTLNREDVRVSSMRWSWKAASQKFIDNLVPIK